jgi:hypothetical protein
VNINYKHIPCDICRYKLILIDIDCNEYPPISINIIHH